MAAINAMISTSLTFLILAFLLYTPLPAQVEEPWIYRTYGVLSDLTRFVSLIMSKLIGWSMVEILRKSATSGFSTVHHKYPELEVENLRFEGVPVRVYRPKSLKGPAPCIIYLHGGGWTFMNVDIYDSATTFLALGTGMIVISVDYRLAPENPYPVPLDDCLKATKYVLQNGHLHGIDVKRVAISGDSAGGNLATVVALRLAEEDSDSIPPLKHQVLLYPVTQAINFRTSSYRLYKNYPVLNQKQMTFFAACYFDIERNDKTFKAMEKNYHLSSYIRRPLYSKYFNDEHLPDYVRPNPVKDVVDPIDDNADEEIAQRLDSIVVDPYVSPLLSDNLAKLPPTYMVVVEFDPLRDDGLLYADRLRQAGVKVELSFKKGQPHGFMCPISPIMPFKGNKEEWDTIYAYLKENM